MRSSPAGLLGLRRVVVLGVGLAAFAGLGAACSGDDGEASTEGGGASAGEGGSGASPTTSTASHGHGGGSASGGGGPGGGGAGGSEEASVCARWQGDRADLGEGTWSGSVASCNAGDTSADGRANALKLVNLYRWLAGMGAVTNDAARDQKAQACALMMDANNMLSHAPPASWTCYSQAGAEGAANSNIASTPGVDGVDLYMADPGNETTMGHRRWILSGSLGSIGLGSTDSASCMWVLGGSGDENPPYVAWPSPGKFPSGALHASYASVDQTGWTLQSSAIDLAGAQVTVMDGGENRPVAVTQLAGGFGSSSALRMVPQGWVSEVGHTYAVSVTGTNPSITYEVEIIDCE
ncbi:CAP domain-containing protein [Chondromyces apiculatus]|uniref:SCP domain-containing protein n=1 Tax=Chondromyces apiculatus DSM 436 TaxID=1192034 RepID=A0A017T049_9BACT|nr:CAP domain-containing protein [Chondromyces apiculatus]EYF01936.1 Hypothetical protein CAP_7704 [Chondromyces apiculatus DSM 436]